MPRTKSFDEQEVLDRAVELFWERGYEGTSISDLEERLGIGRQSLYNAFGDKHQLFLRVLRRYSSRNAERMMTTLEAPGAGLEAIRGYFRDLVAFLTPEGERKACLVANSILEIGQGDGEVIGQCQRNQQCVLQGFKHALGNASRAGELPDTFDVDAGATILLAQVYGMSVLAKSGASARDLLSSAEALLDRLQS